MVIAARQEITRQKWPEILDSFDSYISALVIQEAERLAALLMEDGPIPKENPEDTLHIAIATANGMDYLLTWNFTHINNAQMKTKIMSVIEKENYHCPTICSPEELLGE